MMPDDLYNFEALLTALGDHDWHASPLAILAGENTAGKSRVVSEFCRQLIPTDLVLSLDCRTIASEDQLISEAVACARGDELRLSRDQMRPSFAQLVISDSSLTDSRIKVRGSRRRYRRGAESAHQPRGSMIPTLIEDLTFLRRPAWIVADHFDEADQTVLSLVRQATKAAQRRQGLRVLLIMTHAGANGHSVSGRIGVRSPIPSFLVEGITPEAILNWARALGLKVGIAEANLLHALSNGLAGRAWELLMSLAIKEQYRSDQRLKVL